MSTWVGKLPRPYGAGRGSLGSLHVDDLNSLSSLWQKDLCGLVPGLADICPLCPSGRTCPEAHGPSHVSQVSKYERGQLSSSLSPH